MSIYCLRNHHYVLLIKSIGLTLGILLGFTSISQVSITQLDLPHTQDFNSLAFTGTSSTMPASWVFLETGVGSNSTYVADAGATATENTYSYGTGTATERALGQLSGATISVMMGAPFINNTGSTITSLLMQYTGEQWRLGATSRTDRLDFQYSTNATAIDNGTWTDVDVLDFTAPVTTGIVGALDGNAVANRTLLGNIISGLSIANGATVWIRWNSFDATGNDDGLAIDDFALTANPILHYTVTNNGITLSITDTDGNGEPLSINQVGTNIRFFATGRTYALNGGPTTAMPVDVAIAGLTFIVINAGTGNDTINVGAFTTNLPNLTINGGIDNDVVNLNGDINFVAGAAFNADLQNDNANPGIDKFIVAANANIICAAAGIATVRVSHSILLNSGSSIVTNNGNLVVEANQQVVPTVGDFIGLELNNALLQTSGTGTTTIKGKGGSTGGNNQGILISGGGDILGGTSGALTMTGTGGITTGNANHGIFVTGPGSTINSGGGNVSLTGIGGGTGTSFANYGVVCASNGTISCGGTGSTTLNGTGGNSTGGLNLGVYVATSGTITSNSGPVSVTGTGGGGGGSGTHNYGVYVQGGGKITAGSTGNVTVNGTGGSATGSPNDGVTIWEANSIITSSGGDVSVTGQGGGSPTSGSNVGVHLQGTGKISAGGSGDVTVTGTGGATQGNNNFGIFVIDDGTSISSAGGAVTLVGVGGGSGSSLNNYGIVVYQGLVSSGGPSAVSLTGTGGASTGTGNFGIRVSDSPGTVTSGGGDITLTGIEGSGPDAYAISIYSSGTVTTETNGGDITLIGNSMNFAALIKTNASDSVQMRPYTNGVDVFVGPTSNIIGGPLHLSDAELDFLSTGTFLIGNATTGTVTVSSSVTRAAITNIGLVSGDDVIIDGGSINSNGGNVLLDPGAAPDAVRPLQAGNDITCGTLSFGSDLAIVIDGLIADSEHTQLNVIGEVNLAGVSLVLSGTYDPQPGDVFTIVANDGADLIAGTFTGLAEGASVVSFLGSDFPATISYIGGTGNDVVLTVGSPDYIVSNDGDVLTITDRVGNGETMTVSQSGANISFSVPSRTYSLNGGAVTNLPVDNAIAGLDSIFINTTQGNDVITFIAITSQLPSLTINGGTGDETINFNSDITFIANASLDADLQNDDAVPGTDQVSFGANANLILSGTGSAIFKVSRNVSLLGGSSLVTGNGNLTVEANQQSTPTTGTFNGVSIASGALIQATGTGIVTVKGKGGTSGGNQNGINIVSGDIIGGTTGTTIIEGTGGITTGNTNTGLTVTSTGASITTNGSHLMVTGLGGGSGAALVNLGVNVGAGGMVSAGGSGNVTIHGTGGAATSNTNEGVRVSGAAALITSSGGNVSVTGIGGGQASSASCIGIVVSVTAQITAGGTGTVTLTGTGGTGSGATNSGILIQNSTVTSNGGNVSLTGTAMGSGTSGSSRGVHLSHISSATAVSAGGSGTVTITGTGGIGSGTLNYGILLEGSMGTITSSGGNVTVTGNGGGTGGSTNAAGVNVSGGSITAGGSGTVTVTGTGGPGTGTGNAGVSVGGQITSSGGNVNVTGNGGSGATAVGSGGVNVALGSITAGGLGNISVIGTGSPGSGGTNYGVLVTGATGAIRSNGGNISIEGYGGGSGNGNANHGLTVQQDAEINAMGQGDITIIAEGGATADTDNHGVYLALTSARIITNDGDITITSSSNATGASAGNVGLSVTSTTYIEAGGTGNMLITGTGGFGTGNSNYGVLLTGADARLTSNGGNISVTGTGGGSGGAGSSDLNHGIRIDGSADINALNNGNILLQGIVGAGNSSRGIYFADPSTITTLPTGGNVRMEANSMNLVGSPVVSSPAGTTVTLTTYDPGIDVHLGDPTAENAGGPLKITDAEIELMAVGYLILGDNLCGNVVVLGDITRPSTTKMELHSGEDVIIQSGIVNTSGGDLLLNPGPSPYAVKPIHFGTDVQVNTLSFASDLAIEINGLVADTQYTQLNVVGAVNLTGVDLILSGTHVTSPGQTFTIIKNDLADAVTGTFTGLAEGATIPFFLGGNFPATISYIGGTGNDVVITVSTPHYSVITAGNNLIITDIAGNGETATISENGVNYRFAVAGRNYSLNGAAIVNLPVDIPIAGLNSITINTTAGNDIINHGGFTNTLPDLTINGGAGDDNITLNGDITFIASADLDMDLQNDDPVPGTDQINFASGANIILSGTGTATLNVSRNVLMNTTSSLILENGDLMVQANVQATPSGGNFVGVDLNNALLQVTGTGDIYVEGEGGTGASQVGVQVRSGGDIIGGTTDAITIIGQGGLNNNGSNMGVNVTGTGSSITSTGASIEVTGFGGGVSFFGSNNGVNVASGGSISSGGNGYVSVTGTGGFATSIGSEVGVAVFGANSIISSNNGNVTVTGTGGGTGSSPGCQGVILFNEGKIAAGGIGNVLVTGTGGPATGGTQYGVYVSGAMSSITSANGNVEVYGTGGGSGTSNASQGVVLLAAASIKASGAGNTIVEGIGGPGTGSNNSGVVMQNAGTLISSSGGNVQVTGQAGGSSGSNSNTGISTTSGSTISALENGNLTITGTGGSPTGNNNMGISMGDCDYVTEGGNIVISANGGGTGASSGNTGLSMSTDATILVGGNGTVTINATGGNISGTGGSNNHGIHLSGNNSLISSTNGNVAVLANGGGSGAGTTNHGMFIQNLGTVSAGGTGQLSVTGIGGNSTGNTNHGVSLTGASALITSAGGNITVTGSGGGTGTSGSCVGVDISSGAKILGAGTGGVTVSGNGGPGTGTANYGVHFTQTNSTISTSGGPLAITGVEGGGPNGLGILHEGTASITTLASGGNIQVRTNSINLSSSISTNAMSSVTLLPLSAIPQIELGAAGDVIGGPMRLTDGELDNITCGTLIIGSDSTGTIDVKGNISRTASTQMRLISGNDVLISTGQIHTNGGDLFLDPGALPSSFFPLRAGVDAITDTLVIEGDLAIEINGLVPDTDYDQLNAQGKVDVSGASLSLSGSYMPMVGDSFVIVNNDASDMIICTFTGLPEGDTIFNFLGSMLLGIISYEGGNGNDAVITVAELCANPEVFAITASPDTACEGTLITLTITDGDLGGATDWHWYGNGCGNDPVGLGTSIMVTPAVTTTYYVRGEGGCVVNDDCAQKTVVIHPYPDATIHQEAPNTCYYTNRTYRPEAPVIPGATYLWNFGSTAIPSTANGYGPHNVYYVSAGPKEVRLVIYPNSPGAQCPDSSLLSFTIINCPGQIIGRVQSTSGNPIPAVNVRLYVDANTDGIADSTGHIRSINTNATGFYAMSGLTPGHFVIVQTQPSGWISHDDGDASPDGDVVSNIDSLDNIIPTSIIPSEVDSMNVYVESPAPGAITGYVFNDFDNDEIPETGEGLENIEMNLFADQNTNGVADGPTPIATVLSNASGLYQFSNVQTGHYVVVEVQPVDFASIKDFDQSNDGDVVPNTNMTNDTIPVTITNGETDAHNYFIETPACGLIVTSLNDAGPGTFRSALDCAQNGDTIIFHPALSGLTIQINSTILDINKDIVIYSDLTPRVTLASQITGLFYVQPGAIVEFAGVNFVSGVPLLPTGAAFINEGVLSFQDVMILRNPLFGSGEYLIQNQNNGEIIFSGNCFLERD